MKKILFYALTAASALLCSCELFELDNYDGPGETIRGAVVDAATGNPVLTDQGSEGIRVRMTELSWGDNVEHNPDFFCRPDGTFQNTKVFKGRYNVRVDGPFIPIVREDERGVPLADESKTLDIDGVTDVRFEVQPFLNVEFVGDPMVSNGRITARVRVTRGVSEAGSRVRDLLGKPVTIKSNKGQAIPSGRKVFVRAAARINYDTPRGDGTRRWNYSAPVEVLIP